MEVRMIEQALAALRTAAEAVDEAKVLLEAELPEADDRLGEIAHLHLDHLERTGQLTVADSREMRRAMFGPKMRATANLFGRKGEGALFYRKVASETRTKPDQPVRLTDVGLGRARRYRADRGLPDPSLESDVAGSVGGSAP